MTCLAANHCRAHSHALLVRSLSALATLVAAVLYFVHVPNHPPGFSIDESSICYNAWTISQTGHDEYGQAWPLFFRAFGEYKSPVIIYLLAALFSVVGPGITAARLLAASCGFLGAVLLGCLTWQMTRRWVAAGLVTVTAFFTPWLFEASRLVFEVALYPAVLALFLLAVWRAHLKPRWDWFTIFALALTLALLTYSYSIGRLLAPLLALGLGLFGNRDRWPGIVKTWIAYGSLCLPLLLFYRQNPEALTGRFKALTYLNADNSVTTNVGKFIQHYLANLNPARWLVTGENNIRDHVEQSEVLLAATVALAVAGVIIILRYHRRDRWWQFVLYSLVVSAVPASLTDNPFPQLRLIAFPVLFIVLTVPTLDWLTEPGADQKKGALLVVTVILIASQGLSFQRLYHEKALGLWYVFDARFPRKVLDAALASQRRPIYLLNEPGKAGYIQALWYGVLKKVDPTALVRLPWGQAAPPGSILISTEETCQDCRLIARALNYIIYSVPPYPPENNAEKKPLETFAATIVCETPHPVWSGGQQRSLSFLVKNVSANEWPCLGGTDNSHAVILQTRWLGQDETVVPDTEREQTLPYDIEPGDTFGMTVPITPPSAPGRYYVEVDLVQKGVARFGERGSAAYRSPVEVVP